MESKKAERDRIAEIAEQRDKAIGSLNAVLMHLEANDRATMQAITGIEPLIRLLNDASKTLHDCASAMTNKGGHDPKYARQARQVIRLIDEELERRKALGEWKPSKLPKRYRPGGSQRESRR